VPLLTAHQRECWTGAFPFKRREELIDEPLVVTAEAAERTQFGDQDGVDRQA
jgi:hypothetical protein